MRERKRGSLSGLIRSKKGQVTLVTNCIPEMGQQIWPVGMQLSTMLPCGNFDVYREMMWRRFRCCTPAICRCSTHLAIEQASAIAKPLLMEMLEAVVK